MGTTDAASDSLATNPPIVLIHGLWMTPRSWEHWMAHYERRGYEVLDAGLSGPRGRGRGAARATRRRSRR